MQARVWLSGFDTRQASRFDSGSLREKEVQRTPLSHGFAVPAPLKGSQVQEDLNMSDVEMMCARNWEQRKHAEEYAASVKWDWEGAAYVDADPVEMREKERAEKKAIKRQRKLARAARDAGRVALGMGTVSALVGLDLMGPMFLLVAVVFYAIRFELDPECEGLWTRIIE